MGERTQKRIEELERKVRELEARPIAYPPVYVPYPVPYIPPYQPLMPAPWVPWYIGDTVRVGDAVPVTTTGGAIGIAGFPGTAVAMNG